MRRLKDLLKFPGCPENKKEIFPYFKKMKSKSFLLTEISRGTIRTPKFCGHVLLLLLEKILSALAAVPCGADSKCTGKF